MCGLCHFNQNSDLIVRKITLSANCSMIYIKNSFCWGSKVKELKLFQVASNRLEEVNVAAGVGRLTESNLMAHSILSAPFHPFQYPNLLWSVSELGSQCGKKDRKRSQWRKRQTAVASMCHELRKQVPYISTSNKQLGEGGWVAGVLSWGWMYHQPAWQAGTTKLEWRAKLLLQTEPL